VAERGAYFFIILKKSCHQFSSLNCAPVSPLYHVSRTHILFLNCALDFLPKNMVTRSTKGFFEDDKDRLRQMNLGYNVHSNLLYFN
jgi:hypothetical protein